MDGYAILAGPADRRLTVVGESRAGTPADHALQAGEAIRISTGAAVPAGATAVIPQENVECRRRSDRDPRPPSMPARHVRAAGEDMRAGTTVLTAGTLLGGVELGAVGGRRRWGRSLSPAGRAWLFSAPVMSSEPPASRWARARFTTPTRRC